MNTRQVIAFTAAVLITAANLYGMAAYTNAGARNGQHTRATSEVIQTLPTIHVTPTPEQLRELRNDAAKPGSAATAARSAMMPYYSFAGDTASA